jgi:hypothetical protein
MKTKYYGIQAPDGLIWWIEQDEHRAWYSFFDNTAKHRLPMYEAIKAYEAIGYRCVELEPNIVQVCPTREERLKMPKEFAGED